MIFEEKRIDLDGHELFLRSPREEDAEILLAGLKQVCGETHFLTMEADEIEINEEKIEQEKRWINSLNEGEHDLCICAFLDGTYIGNAAFNGDPKKKLRHHVVIGIAIFEEYTGLGIGTILLRTLIEEARKRGYEMLELRAVATNERAIHVYKKLGFVEFGRAPRYTKLPDGTYADDIWMMLELGPAEA